MIQWRATLVHPDAPIVKAIEVIDAGALQIALVVDAQGRLQGTVTDGDIRRAILRGVSLNDAIETIMFAHPTVASTTEGRETLTALMRTRQLRQIPVVDEEGRVVGLEVRDDLLGVTQRDNLVLLMAGGLGTRLGALTKDRPKPLLTVRDKPVLEAILEHFKTYGFQRFVISVNYKAEMVQEYFGDGSRWGVAIDYLRETKRLGTAGALGLLTERPLLPLVVINADLRTNINLEQLLNFHEKHRATATMCIHEYDVRVPYGVVRLDRHRLLSIEEKPISRHFVNAGIYVLNPEVLDLVPRGEPMDMPTVFEKLLALKREAIAFPIREDWLDIGAMDDYKRANGDLSGEYR